MDFLVADLDLVIQHLDVILGGAAALVEESAEELDQVLCLLLLRVRRSGSPAFDSCHKPENSILLITFFCAATSSRRDVGDSPADLDLGQEGAVDGDLERVVGRRPRRTTSAPKEKEHSCRQGKSGPDQRRR